MNTVIFARGKNIREQVEHCQRYAEEKGYKVNGVIVGGSHEITETIKGLQESIEIDRVLVKCMSRISRNALEGYAVLADLELQCGVIVEVANDDLQEAAVDRFMRSVVLAAKEEETRMRIRRAFRERFKEC